LPPSRPSARSASRTAGSSLRRGVTAAATLAHQRPRLAKLVGLLA
jgi:hypothetical protein